MIKVILPDKSIVKLFDTGEIISELALDFDQIQPASLDLRLSSKGYQVRAAFLPNDGYNVLDKIEMFGLNEFDLSDGVTLNTNCIYIIPLMESLCLRDDISAYVNPKSSTGRIDVFVRVIADKSREFDRIPAGYKGNLYLEVSPRTFPIIVRSGSRLSQIRFRQECNSSSEIDLKSYHDQDPLIVGGDFNFSDEGVSLSLDLSDNTGDGIIGYKAKRHTASIDIDAKGKYDIADFWEVIHYHGLEKILIDPNEFYILSSRETVRIPPSFAAEMIPYDPRIGEFRSHYAGFFDSGFGHSPECFVTKAVLEVRSLLLPFILEDGQVIARLKYESMMEKPDRLYGDNLGSNYQYQRLKLSKHFRDNI
ncbi:2'-deoxycytidine 5'-triphosphate deaminase [Candidatus Liberibacter americanus]|uniref:Deoxycytidine deaminase n=1 Tax=Candidatus Liberibacter americanus str. Sao Paulo TaxID=1261131 RepID=U6B352_9HYPH|nr:2'-deoxycytidine 5'-triphosphate deaminase [Candidatus Liberibacter americanus]AHA27489.1 Deoxycytidine deaminase [Candidatus Liberibacter americanus str. Sao Paulo]EMS36549.1 2'-deoxycytidine 5'-triphosphate deaminase [Candidatus Liberibacter americanus PW_SP]